MRDPGYTGGRAPQQYYSQQQSTGQHLQQMRSSAQQPRPSTTGGFQPRPLVTSALMAPQLQVLANDLYCNLHCIQKNFRIPGSAARMLLCGWYNKRYSTQKPSIQPCFVPNQRSFCSHYGTIRRPFKILTTILIHAFTGAWLPCTPGFL